MANRKKTKTPPTPEERRAEFLKRRRTGLGGSDVGAIMGVDQYKDSLDVYMDKVSPPEDIDNPNMERGRMLEPVVSLMYELRTGRRLRTGKFRRNRDLPFLIGSPDRIINPIGRKPYEEPDHSPGVLEIKTANRFVLKKMQEEGLPKSYILQLQHYMGLCGTDWGAFAVLCADPWQFLTFTVEFDQELYDRVCDVLQGFWEGNVEAQVAPIPKVIDYGDSKEVTADTAITIFEPGKELVQWEKNVDLFREAQAMTKLGNEAKEFAKNKLQELMTLGLGIYEGGGARIHYKEQKGRRSFMERELRAMQPIDPIAMAVLLEKAGLGLDDIEVLFDEARMDLDQFVKRGDPFKTFRMYDSKEIA
jgi:putative phage-type endonuclease